MTRVDAACSLFGRTSPIVLLIALTACGRGPSTPLSTSPTPGGDGVTKSKGSTPTSSSAIAPIPVNDTPYGAIEEVLRASPAEPGVRRRLVATAQSSPASANLRYAALHALEQAQPSSDTLAAAVVVAGLPGSTPEERWLVDNAISVLIRLDSPDARAALASFKSSGSFKADAANLFAASGKER